MHSGDPSGQCATNLSNLRTLLAQAGANELHQLGAHAAWKVYLRNASDFMEVRSCLGQALDPTTTILYVIGNICRKPHLLEIEGVINMRPTDKMAKPMNTFRRNES